MLLAAITDVKSELQGARSHTRKPLETRPGDLTFAIVGSVNFSNFIGGITVLRTNAYNGLYIHHETNGDAFHTIPSSIALQEQT